MIFPEQFRARNTPELVALCYASNPGDGFGVFFIPASKAPRRRHLKIIACDAADPMSKGWEHVSVSVSPTVTQPPYWDEMCFVKQLFWEPEACVVQYHPPQADYINITEGVLHLWRYSAGFPMPPKIFV
jgi:hypothetical protein